jgi:hypothetical protein
MLRSGAGGPSKPTTECDPVHIGLVGLLSRIIHIESMR